MEANKAEVASMYIESEPKAEPSRIKRRFDRLFRRSRSEAGGNKDGESEAIMDDLCKWMHFIVNASLNFTPRPIRDTV